MRKAMEHSFPSASFVACVPKKTNTVTVKKRPCVDSLDSGDD